MILRNDILEYLNGLLMPENFNDYGINGLQVEGKAEIRKVVAGVSVSERLFRAAIDRQADLILVHHGLWWHHDTPAFAITGVLYQRLRLLMQHEINLLGYHLPLDAHPEVGNNAQILKKLDLKPICAVDVGFLGELVTPVPFSIFCEQVNRALDTHAFTLAYGPAEVKKVVVISGGSSPSYHQVVALGADTFICGDIREHLVREVEEVHLNLIHAGHYNTEKFGVQALCQRLNSRFSIPCEFIDIPNPV